MVWAGAVLGLTLLSLGCGDSGPGQTEDGATPPASCGDGIVDSDEQCDDGNRMNDDGCDWRCRSGDGEAPIELPPDPDVVRVGSDLGPFEFPLDDLPDANLAAPNSPGNRIPMASDGETFAVVWPHWVPDGDWRRVEGTFLRLDEEGRRVGSPWSYRLGSGGDGEWMVRPRVDLAWKGAGYGLVWTGRPVIPPGGQPGASFLALDRDGKPLGEPVDLSTRSGFGDRLGIAWDGVGYVCAGDQLGPSECGDLAFLLLDTRGGRRTSECGGLGTPHYGLGIGSVAASGHRSVVAWTESGTGGNWVRFALLDDRGMPLDDAVLGLEADGLPAPPDVVWTGSEFGVVWLGPGEGEDVGRFYLARLSAEGVLLEAPRALLDVPYESLGGELAAVFAHETYGIGWVQSDGRVNLLRADRNGTLIEHAQAGPSGLPVVAGAVGLAANASGFGLVGAVQWEDGEGGGSGRPFFAYFSVMP